MAYGRWFRYYDEALNDPKVQVLSGDQFKGWVNLLSLASKADDGALPDIPTIAFNLRMNPEQATQLVNELAAHGLLDNGGNGFVIHNWSGRQRVSDISTNRVKAFRETTKKQKATVSRNTNETASETPVKRDVKRNETVQEERRVEAEERQTRTEQNPESRSEQAAASAREGDFDYDKMPRGKPQRDKLGTNIHPKSAALSQDICQAFEDAGLPVPKTHVVDEWLGQNYDPIIILAVVKQMLVKKPDMETLGYCTKAIKAAHDQLAPKIPDQKPKEIQWDKHLSLLFSGISWHHSLGPAPGNAGCQVPPSILGKYHRELALLGVHVDSAGNPTKPAPVERRSLRSVAGWETLVEGFFTNTVTWPAAEGPDPNHDDCRAPRNIIEKFKPKVAANG